MDDGDSIVLYIILRQSLQSNNENIAYYIADAIQYILLKYFTWQILAVKTNLDSLVNNDHLKTTTEWLSSKSKKSIVFVDEEIWDKLKKEYNMGKDLFCLKNMKLDLETTLILWPTKQHLIPSYLLNIDSANICIQYPNKI